MGSEMCIRDRITYDPKTASGFQKLSSSAIEIGNIPLITGPIFGIIVGSYSSILLAPSLLLKD